MDNVKSLDDRLQQLVQQACSYPPGSLERQQRLNQLIRAMQQSGKIWRAAQQMAAGDISADDYSDALQMTWLYVCRNLCEATTGKAYDPTIANLFTWMNAYLRHRLNDMGRARQHQEQMQAKPIFNDGEWLDPLQNVPARPPQPTLLEGIQTWLAAQEAELRSVHVRNHPEANSYVLIQRRLPPETRWTALSEEFGISVATLSSFYQRECLPRLRAFGASEGYL